VKVFGWYDNEWGFSCRMIDTAYRHDVSKINSSLMKIKRLVDLDLKGKRVFIRSDLNVPIQNGKITSPKRILASIPTIEFALQKGASVMVTSHLGRPEGKGI
jgi:hypothetical protein